MANVKLAYGTATALTFSNLSTLASGTLSAASTAVDNTTNLYLDYLIEINVTVGTVVAPAQCLIYAADTVDSTNFQDVTSTLNLRLLGVLATPTSTNAYRSSAFSLAAAFGGVIPPKFQILVYNSTGAALTAGTGQYLGVYSTVV